MTERDCQISKETAKTLLQEEQEFKQVAAHFSPHSMKAAWNEQKMSNIDYSRADEQTQDEFMNFYNGLLAERDYMKRVKQSEDPLLAGAAMRRTVDFFELMALQYMYVDAGLIPGMTF